MPNLPTDVPAIKGAIPECLDIVSRRRDARDLLTTLQTEIKKLQKQEFQYLETVFAKNLFSIVYTEQDFIESMTEYLKKYWFDASSKSAYFPLLQPIAPVYAEGILTTLALSLRTKGKPTPIDAWWLVGHSEFDMINLVNEQQITLLIATPRPGLIAKSPPKQVESEVWSTKRSKVESRRYLRNPKSK